MTVMTATAMTTAGGTAEIGIVKIMTILGAGGMMANEKNASQRAVTANAKLETAVTAVNEATAESEEHAIVSAVSGMEMRGTLTAEIATVGSAMTVGLRRNVRTEASVRMGARGAVTTKRKNVGNARRRRNLRGWRPMFRRQRAVLEYLAVKRRMVVWMVFRRGRRA